MIENYLSNNIKLLFKDFATDKDREWVWMILTFIKKRYPKADHWATGEKNRKFTIRIGKKNPENSRGIPVFYFPRLRADRKPCLKLANIIQDRLVNIEPINSKTCKDESALIPWFDSIESQLGNLSDLLEGSSLNPINYPIGDEVNDGQIEEDDDDDDDDDTPEAENYPSSISPLNQILYGPPGTGKTYSTIDAALEIIDPLFLASRPEMPDTDWETQHIRREELKQRFDELSKNKRIRFVTFHQSFSYEDFVEGIRALPLIEGDELSSGSIQYQVEKGIFVQLCEDAKRDKIYEERVGVRENAKVWKISIEEANSSGETRRYCFSHGEARIGWPIAEDIRKTNLADPELGLGGNDQSSLANFGRDIVPGDVLVCLKTRTQICAVGIVTGEYEYTEQVPQDVRADYVHKLPVKWLATDIEYDITELNDGVGLTLKTVYLLWRIKWPALQDALHKANIVLADEVSVPEASTDPYVLIIDEINRGNVSRVFGELITLIEPSKRAKAEEALETLLPYSKQPFSVPKNVYLIGTMNTADRSLAGLDIALRRRFTFKEMPPRPDLLDNIHIESLNIGQLLLKMNERIEVLLDRDHCLGHAYFMPLKDNPTLENLAFIFSQQILPLLQEYFFEDWERIRWVFNDHRKFFDYQFIKKQDANTSQLFGGDVNIGNQQTIFRINTAAFYRIESYLGILDHQKALKNNNTEVAS